MSTCAASPLTVTGTASTDDLDLVVAAGAGDRHAVGRAVAGSAAGRRAEIERDLRDAGAGQVADRDGVGAAEGREVDRARRR